MLALAIPRLPGFSSLSAKSRYLILLILAVAVVLALVHQFSLPFYYALPQRTTRAPPPPTRHSFSSDHPINSLIWKADEEWRRLLGKQSHNLRSAASEYRLRRGRHPPPGFDEWFKYAEENNAVIVEEFFDQIYHDLTPFWAIEPAELRRQAASIDHRVIVQNHSTTVVSSGNHMWMPIWSSMIESLQAHLPDVIVPLNVMDESRVIVPWEKMSEYEATGRAKRDIPPPNDVLQNYTKIPGTEPFQPSDPPFDPRYEGPGQSPYWKMAVRGCPPSSPARTNPPPALPDFSTPQYPTYLNDTSTFTAGYVSNCTSAKDPCQRPELQSLHGNFIEPVSISTSQTIQPLFGGSKLSVNNEILLPAAMYYAEKTIWSGDEEHGGPWEHKADKLVWRGAATGGRNRDANWRGFHRHRFIAMMNGSTVARAESGEAAPENFLLPDYEAYQLAQTSSSSSPKAADKKQGNISPFLLNHTDASFVHLVCFPAQPGPDCPYTSPHLNTTPGIPMDKQYKNKYLADLDGNSFSGRYRGFLLSTSLPLKATLYNEWHDTRLVPWVHFVPLDSTFVDVYGVLEYFLAGEGRDAVAKKIALDGKGWAERVLRREDMRIYTYRLLLEWARVCDENREKLGFVGDLRGAVAGMGRLAGGDAIKKLFGNM
ncbi:hypothetical protein AJ79_07144 [Helicocarpus griseus UAMH5409]|uniref:Glycosyl transferase CAP10 domain-containing protein n=1 Tax=Helicocarpus griseus UAMH5409 TaxID=1447875 RepID=A0A2B7X6D4_9EURO|nr:hypothetical protein AJ79_07144 [Helicocarpus griseus UAMH5409]